MSGVELLAVALVMAVGVVGVVVPVMPGLLLVWGAGVWWTIADGGGAGRWAVLAVMSALFVAGALAKYVLPGRAASAAGAPFSTMLIGAVCAVIGFFVVPVLGLLVGGLAGIYLAELTRLRDARRATASTWVAVVAFGVGLLVELGAAVAMAATWGVGELVS
ncbi:conserved hypothetical protein [Parafrankia sp. EAN1pec]|uniref:DUF456 domain-containing protein n=1 Tax=Parafrankia sp. (strain EAN1pec) TaxID=298653 RepID=UPI0000541A82|nr:conserved hypothetical protein [Frankia sp. EAN1pec]